ncbi:hypothetical protein [Vibrio mangrovi]|uniref:Uncharacterized protein n=1 Tax=Vibrio mangrovi TaxID=474394 RepID=A0A1Y6J0G6_9VIBR|nr:hypothetical protein [Vibrio mangrovi]MDW6002360.1 hypothetical protein [Vibrio mangrovi]SMS02741.1 hypothetical protein VIM7927_04081 [Vibrio mangrovi]
MKIVKEGDKRQVVCPVCGLSLATYALRDIDFSDQSGTVKNVLAAVCDTCQKVVSIPKQSTAKVRAEYNKVKTSVDVRLPAHYLDILTLAAQKIDPTLTESFNKPLVLYYLHALSRGRYPACDLSQLLESDLAKARASKRFSLKLNEKSLFEVKALMTAQGLKSNTDVFKSVILKINEDLVQGKVPEHLPELQNFAAAFG